MPIRLINTPQDLQQVFPVARQLRPQYDLEGFVERALRLQERHGYQVAVMEAPRMLAYAGFRVAEWLYSGAYLEIEDLVVDQRHRGAGYGRELLQWLKERALVEGCQELRLVSGMARTEAHRLYRQFGMRDVGLYFTMPLDRHHEG